MINGYYCKFCNLYNDILTHYCEDCKELQLEQIEPFLVSQVALQRTGEYFPMDEDRIELHKKLFNSAVIVAEQMTDEQLDKHIRELSKICFEAKTGLNGAESVKRKRNALLSPKSREWLV